MPVTITAKRALRVSARKGSINKIIITRLEAAIRLAKRDKAYDTIKQAMSLADQAAKKKTIHKNKAARIKSSLAKLVTKPAKKATVKAPTAKKRLKKTSKKK